MDQSELERLAYILSKRENGYRDSSAIEATEVSKIIRSNRPDLYDLMINEGKRELAVVPTKALAQVKTERQRFYNLGDLENSVILEEKGQNSLYVGRATKLRLELQYDLIRGHPILTKYLMSEREGWYVKFRPFAIRRGPVIRKKKVWKIEDRDSCDLKTYEYGIVNLFHDSHDSMSYFRHALKENSIKKNLILDDSLIDLVFDPIVQKLKEMYDQIKNSA